MNYEEAKKVLQKYGQEHILNSYERLNEEKKEKLLKQIATIDFEQMLNLYENTKKEIEFKDSKIEPIPDVNAETLSIEEKEK